jgi:putative chitinase
MQAKGVTTQRRMAAFLARCSVETGGFVQLRESLNYNPQGLLRTFGAHRISPADAQRLGRQRGERMVPIERQLQIADLVYGGTWGLKKLGNRLGTTDARDYIGGGILQLTGYDNHLRFGKAIGKTPEEIQHMNQTREGACDTAVDFWTSRGCNELADRGDTAGWNRAVNGGDIGMADAIALYRKALAV